MTRRGYKQTVEHIVKRKRFGVQHPNWKGQKAVPQTGRSRAERLYSLIGACQRCGDPKAERHHKDGNTLNNAASNIEILCRRCHMKADGRIQNLSSMAKRRISEVTEAAAQEKRSRTTCKRGHLLSGENVYINPAGHRICKTCRKIHKLRSKIKCQSSIKL